MEVLPYSDLTPWGIVTVMVLMIAVGYLVPRWMHNQRMKDKDLTITYLQGALDKRDDQVGTLIKQNEVIIKLLEDIKASGRRNQVRS